MSEHQKTYMIDLNILHPMFPTKLEKVERLEDFVTKEVGFIHPLVILKTTREKWLREQKARPDILDPPKTSDPQAIIYQIRAGHNRIELLKKWGSTHAQCLLYDNYLDAGDKMREQVKWQKKHNVSLD